MGGHASGEVASQMAVELISELYYRDERFDTGAVLKDAIETASSQIYQTSLTDEKYFGMGTTLVALVLQNQTAYIAHVGDSRVYLLRAGKFQQITEDHSQVMEMVKYGIISREEAKTHEDKNVILRAMGTQPEVEAELSAPFAAVPEDTFLLCSDGLCDMVDDEEMHAILLNSTDVHSACENLVEAAKRSGGHDNITVGIVKITASGAAQTETVRVTREINVEI
jgi:protein phosphatase